MGSVAHPMERGGAQACSAADSAGGGAGGAGPSKKKRSATTVVDDDLAEVLDLVDKKSIKQQEKQGEVTTIRSSFIGPSHAAWCC